MNIGGLREVVTLTDVRTVEADGDGGYTPVQSTLSPSPVRAEIRSASARDLERVQAGSVIATDALIVRMRFHPTVNTHTRLAWTDQAGRAHVANVTGVHPVDGRTRELLLVAVEVVS